MTVDASVVVALTLANKLIGAMGVVAVAPLTFSVRVMPRVVAALRGVGWLATTPMQLRHRLGGHSFAEQMEALDSFGAGLTPFCS